MNHHLPHLNAFNLPVLVAAIMDFSLVVLVLSKTARRAIHWAFAGLFLALTVWNVGAFGLFGAASAEDALWWGSVCYYGNTLIPGTFLHLVLLLCDEWTPRRRLLLGVVYGVGISLVGGHMFRPSFLNAGVQLRFWGYCPVGGPGTLILDPLIVGTCLYCLWLLHKTYRISLNVRRYQLQYVFWGLVVSVTGGFINVLMERGLNIYPFGNICNIVFSLAVAYAIISYQWMDVRLVLRQSLVYGSLGTAMTLTYVGMVYFIEKTIFDHHLDPVWVPRLLALPPTMIAAPPLKSWLQPWIEFHLFPAWEKQRRILQNLGLKICTCLDVKAIADSAVNSLNRDLGLTGASLLWMDPSTLRFTSLLSAGTVQVDAEAAAGLDAAWISLLNKPVVRGELAWQLQSSPWPDPSLSALSDWLKHARVEVLIPVQFQEKRIGLWLLGANRTSSSPGPHALAALEQVASQIALALHNALAVRQLEEQQAKLQKNQEMVVMGKLAMELAHELAKPLTHILNAGFRLEKGIEENHRGNLLTIEREAQRATEILDGFSMLSPSSPLQRILVSLPDILEEAVRIVGVDADRRVRIVKHFEKLPPVPANPGQLAQVFANLIQNAWQAMPDGGSLTMRVRAIPAVEPATVEIGVRDTGAGIPPEITGRIFEPFFTTKKHLGGRGVGLTISRAMVERHGGQITIKSPLSPQGGTEVFVRLPMNPLEGSNAT